MTHVLELRHVSGQALASRNGILPGALLLLVLGLALPLSLQRSTLVTNLGMPDSAPATQGAAPAPAQQAGTTYYVRTDGGTARQCTGRVDAAYPGSGANQACAWNSLHVALPPSGRARIDGGDTVIVGSGTYKIGYGAPGADGGRCYDGARYDCNLAPVPSGKASARTRILGAGHDVGCKAPPRLWGTERVGEVLNLEGSSNVEIGCLEITDQSDCVDAHSQPSARCERDTAPFGEWAAAGIEASDSHNVWLHDLDIHGLAHTGIHAGRLQDWTLERVRIKANGWVGWDGDIGDNSSNTGQMIFRNVEIAWNGCGQKWRTGDVWACWAQQAGGYGDGLGTNTTGGQWLFEDSYVHHNTSDGIDLLYLDGAPTTSVTVRRVRAQANAGNQVKTKGNALIENSIIVGQCSYFDGRDAMQAGDQCRAEGNALSVGLVPGQAVTVRHNTLTGDGDCLLLASEGDATSTLQLRNNAFIGATTFKSRTGAPRQTCGLYIDEGQPRIDAAGNLGWNLKNGSCVPGGVCDADPRVANIELDHFDAMPQAGSPLLDKAVPQDNAGPDQHGHARDARPDIGALERP